MSSRNIYPRYGEIWTANLNPTRGHEQAGARPVLIVSTNGFNKGAADLVFILPLTRTDRGIPLHVPVEPPEGGLVAKSFLMCDMLRSISKQRLGAQALGCVSQATLSTVNEILRILMNLE